MLATIDLRVLFTLCASVFFINRLTGFIDIYEYNVYEHYEYYVYESKPTTKIFSPPYQAAVTFTLIRV